MRTMMPTMVFFQATVNCSARLEGGLSPRPLHCGRVDSPAESPLYRLQRGRLAIPIETPTPSLSVWTPRTQLWWMQWTRARREWSSHPGMTRTPTDLVRPRVRICPPTPTTRTMATISGKVGHLWAPQWCATSLVRWDESSHHAGHAAG